jgi:hypothetical protein
MLLYFLDNKNTQLFNSSLEELHDKLLALTESILGNYWP